MANTLTAIAPVIFEAMDIVARERVGLIRAVNRNSSVERAAVGQTVTYPVVPAITGEDITPGNDPADSGDQTIGSGSMTISKSRAFPIRWTGEEEQLLRTGDVAQLNNVHRNRFAQAFRAATNEIENDLAGLHIEASRAFGTAGTTPFGTINEMDDLAETLRILRDNGAPDSDTSAVLGSAAIAKLQGYQSFMFKRNEGQPVSDDQIPTIFGAKVYDSAQIKTFTKGTGSGATTNAVGYSVGATTITLASAGTGTILAGDAITFNGDSNVYIVKTGDASTADGGTIVLQAPGLRQAIPASATNITVVGNSARNMVFHRNAIQLVTRMPALPTGGDSGNDRITVPDPVSGLQFEVAAYRQYRRVKYEVAIAWGVEVSKPEFLALLLG